MYNKEKTLKKLSMFAKEIYEMQINFDLHKERPYRTHLFGISQQIYGLIETIIEFAKED